mgnify:CR=1 FL=1
MDSRSANDIAPVPTGILVASKTTAGTICMAKSLIGCWATLVPGASIATDVIVGFPGESDEQFKRTMSLLEEIRFDAVHVAAYSPRPGTAASRLGDDVPPEVKAARRQAVEDLQERIVGEINGQLAGQAVDQFFLLTGARVSFEACRSAAEQELRRRAGL